MPKNARLSKKKLPSSRPVMRPPLSAGGAWLVTTASGAATAASWGEHGQVQALGAHAQIEVEQGDADELERDVQQAEHQGEQRLDDDLGRDQVGGAAAGAHGAQDEALKDRANDEGWGR